MISGSNEKELDIANQIADLLLKNEQFKEKIKRRDEFIKEQQVKIDKAIEYIKITIKIIKEQPSSCELNDIWTLEHLNSFLEMLGDKENE